MSEIIRDELNVKAVEVTHNPAELARISVKPNFKVVGKSLGPRVKELQQLLVDLPADVADKALRGETIVVGSFTLAPEMLTVELQPTGNRLVATDSDIVASLDPEISEELRLEGLARELVSVVQKARKAADFEVEDRIELHVDASSSLLAAIRANQTYIEDETLSFLKETLAKPASYSMEMDLEGEKVRLSMLRV